MITNQIAERPIRDILGLRDVTLSPNVQIQHAKKRSWREPACYIHYMREMLAVRFDRLASHLFLVVGREIHRESFVIAVSWMWNVRMRMIASLSLPLPRLPQRGGYTRLKY